MRTLTPRELKDYRPVFRPILKYGITRLPFVVLTVPVLLVWHSVMNGLVEGPGIAMDEVKGLW